ncbi:MAG TPA: hypothetical protein VGV87_04795 [Blastocatellia bacterium]|jgi:hypothetical protein|nr:hypothetical protein [Blastocatellia bacterium]
MFIPRGKAVHENLASSYVLLDALVEDLCEGGFSGIVEVVLRNTDSYVIIDRGIVAAVIEQRGHTGELRGGRLFSITLEELASRSRGERGRISVYSFPAGATAALAGLVDAEPLYTALSTDFADLERMIAKLRRESDREWFVQVATMDGNLAHVHIEDDHCRVLRFDGVSNPNDGPVAEGPALKEVLDECNRAGGTFDVYFRRTAVEGTPAPARSKTAEPSPAVPADAAKHPESVSRKSATKPTETAAAEARSPAAEKVEPPAPPVREEMPFFIEPSNGDQFDPGALIEEDRDRYWSSSPAEPLLVVAASASSSGDLLAAPVSADPAEKLVEETEAVAAASVHGQPVDVEEAEIMAEIKRLMGEIARTIDEACRTIEQRDAFSMYLRAGQLKIADRYPFLDPFGAEFEYLGGEIVFIGKASPTQFREGLTESLRLAVVGVGQSSAQPARLRAAVTDDLRQLLERLRPDLERYGIVESIEWILNF